MNHRIQALLHFSFVNLFLFVQQLNCQISTQIAREIMTNKHRLSGMMALQCNKIPFEKNKRLQVKMKTICPDVIFKHGIVLPFMFFCTLVLPFKSLDHLIALRVSTTKYLEKNSSQVAQSKSAGLSKPYGSTLFQKKNDYRDIKTMQLNESYSLTQT